MQKVTMVITNTGDGANGVLWFKGELTNEQTTALEECDLEYFGSGDGFQGTVFKFPDNFDFEEMGILSFSTVEEYLNDAF